jgi:ATP-dependent RNA helicase RhlE
MPALKRILALLPRQRQSLMFSATFSNEIKKLSEDFMNYPTLIEVARSNASAENITQKVYLVDHADKHQLLAQLLRGDDAKQAIVFTKTKLTASRLAKQLQREGVSADAIHGDKSQLERMQALDAFKQGKIAVLIATDVAARGLDIDSLPMVINYEIPHAAEDYVHRIGRTGRAGASGTAISLVSPEEEKYLADIEKLIKTQIPKERADMPEHAAKPHRASRAEHPERSREHRAPAPKKPSHDPWFDKPYEPSASAPAPVKKPAEPAVNKSKAQIPALFVRRSS